MSSETPPYDMDAVTRENMIGLAIWLSLSLLGFIVVYAVVSANWNGNHVPALQDPIPYLWNSYQYMTDQPGFLARIKDALEKSPIVSFHVGPVKFYMVKSPRSIQALFRTTTSISSNRFMSMVFENMMNFAPQDIAKFDNDLTGRLPTPLPTPADKPAGKRYWEPYHKVLHNYLARIEQTNKLGVTYQRFFEERLEKYKIGEWTEGVHIRDFLYRDMFIAATTAFCGPRMLALTPDLVDIFWKHHEIAASLVYGLPRWLNRRALDIREQFHAAAKRYLETADLDNVDEKEGDWDETWGSIANRELCRFFHQNGFEIRSQAGVLAVTNVFGSNANSIPITSWVVMNIVRDPSLFSALREEINTVWTIDSSSGKRTIDIQKMLNLPLLQSVYIECLRMHMSIHITREVLEPVMFEGHLLEVGSIVQGPAEIIHYQEDNWGVDDHPASEFWAERHIKYVEELDEETGIVNKVRTFSMCGKTTQFFPYGGGVSMCPGRFFAKQEMLLTVSLLISRFDIEFIEWTNLNDGSPSDRPAHNHAKFIGGAAVPPDRDMKVRWKRLW